MRSLWTGVALALLMCNSIGVRAEMLTYESVKVGALMDALRLQNLKQSEQIILQDRGIVNQANTYKMTPLMIAAGSGNLESVKLLLRYGASPSSVDIYGENALFYAQGSGSNEVFEYLLHQGIPLNAENIFGRTILMIASESGDTREVGAILSAGGKASYRNRFSETAIIRARMALNDAREAGDQTAVANLEAVITLLSQHP